MFQLCWSWEIRAMRYINCGSRARFLQKVLEYRCGTGGCCAVLGLHKRSPGTRARWKL